MKNEPLQFTGMNLFPEGQAAQLGNLIRNLTDSQPSLTREVLERSDFALDSSGLPSTIAVSAAEEYAKKLGCAALAIESAHALGKELTPEQTTEILEQAELVYAEIPHLVHAVLSPAQ